MSCHYIIEFCLPPAVKYKTLVASHNLILVFFNMSDFIEQRVCIKFCFNLGKTASETCVMLQAAFW